MTIKHKIAYISCVIYPSPEANALQTIQMAAGFGRQTGDTHLFVHDHTDSELQIRRRYAIDGSPLKIKSIHAKNWPFHAYDNTMARFLIYNSAVVLLLGLNQLRNKAREQLKVLFVRSRLEQLYWGLLRPYILPLRDWVFVTEVHDDLTWLFGFDDHGIDPDKPALLAKRQMSARYRRTKRALANFDLVFCPTSIAAEDIAALTEGAVQPVVLRHGSGLTRPDSLPQVWAGDDQIVLGYIGTIDQIRGVGQLVKALRFLPPRFSLRLVGRISGQAENARMPAWFEKLLTDNGVTERVNIIPRVPYREIASQIAQCDILLQPASDHIMSLRYRSPLKLFDYMVCGKPIIAADVPCHRELLQDGVNARLYRHGDVEHLAACIESLVDQPMQAETIARAAWEQSAEYTYDARAQRILELVNQVKMMGRQ